MADDAVGVGLTTKANRPFPLPGAGRSTVAVSPPAHGFGAWAGAPSAAIDVDGTFVVAYRLRDVQRRGAQTVIARSVDGERLSTVASLDKDLFGAESMERPALIRLEDRWRLYVCCATPGSKHWWITLLEARDPADLATARPTTVFPGDTSTGVKDPVVRRTDDGWEAWICCHPLEEPDEEDRMTTAYATSVDGVRWTWHGPALSPGDDGWDARGTRVTTVLADGRAAYDGRASKEENFSERTGLARRVDGGRLERVGDAPVANVRYLDVVPLPRGGHRLYYERPLADGSHELRTELIEAEPDGA